MIRYQYDKYVLELKKELIQILNTKGKMLIQAPTGGGKTYAMLNVFKELSKLNPNKVYVITCPNRSQNEQNEKQYGVYAIVGGKEILKGLSVASMVYDKAVDLKEYLIKENKELILVTDEAHQLVDSCIFRSNTIKQLEELESIATTSIHLTATPNKLLKLYVYDKIYVFEPVEKEANIENHTLVKLNNKNIITQTVSFLNNVKQKTSDVFLIELNNLDDIKTIYDCLTFKGYKVGVCANTKHLKDTFDKSIYPNILIDCELILKDIRSKAELPKGFDIILSTSILECGISLLNTGVSMAYVVSNHKQLELDSIEQWFARCRRGMKNSYTIIPEAKDKQKSKCRQAIFKELDFNVNKYQREYQETLDFHIKKYGLSMATNHLKTIMKLEEDAKLFYGSLEIEGDKVVVNKKALVKAKFRKYYGQFYKDTEGLNEELKQRIKAKNFKVVKVKDITSEEEKEEAKEIGKTKKEAKDILKKEAKEILKTFLDNDYNFLEEYIKNSDILDNLPINLQVSIAKLEKEETTLRLLKEMLNEEFLIKESIEKIVNTEKAQDVKDYIKRHNYIMRNIIGNPLKVKDEYTVYRKVLDDVMDNRGKITVKICRELIENIIDSKIKKGKEINPYKNMLKKLDKGDQLSEAQRNKLMKVIKMIYNLSKDGKYYKISSLNKKF